MTHRDPLIASEAVSSVAEAPPRAPGGGDPDLRVTGARTAAAADVLLAFVLAAALVALAFVTKGGVDQSVATPGNTWTNVAVTLLGAVAVCVALVTGRAQRWGMATVGFMAALTALEGISIAWSVLPDDSWMGASQGLAYLAAFAAAVMIAGCVPRRWPVLLGAMALAMTALCGWSLLVKVFPATLTPANSVGRLQAPFGYWNALGVSAAVGLPCCLWLGARPRAGRVLAGFASAGLTLMLAVLVLSYSRSADLAAVVTAGLWIVFVPLRLRAAALLALAAIGAAVISGWALTHHAISHDHMAISAQDHSGHTFGIVLVVVVAVVAAAGAWLGHRMDHATLPPRRRRDVGAALLGLVALVPVAAILVLELSSRGLTGEISHGWHQLTNSNAVSTANASRVFQFGSSRPVYWHEGLHVGEHALLKGVGELGFAAARLRETTDPVVVQQAHSYVVETFADLGVLGLVVSALLLLGWLIATARTLGLRARWATMEPELATERAAHVSLAVLVVGFGVQSTLDWTWLFSGVAIPVLLCAGWVAGRGTLTAGSAQTSTRSTARRSILDRPGTVVAVLAVTAVALLGAWMQWQPLRSSDQLRAAENASSGAQAFSSARAASGTDPFSLFSRELLSVLYQSDHDPAAARRQLVIGTEKQSGNPATWLALASFDLQAGTLQQAITDGDHVLFLDHTTDANATQATNIVKAAQVKLLQRAASHG